MKKVLFLLLVIALGISLIACPHKPAPPSNLITFKEGLPIKSGAYIPEIGELIKRGVVEKYGRQEFEAVILAMEIHGHIGAYVLMGAKMGVRAMELLGAERGKMKIISEMGAPKPLRCANDGIIAATSCSAAMDKLIIDKDKSNYAATFEYKGKKIRLELKPEYKAMLEGKIKEAGDKYGLHTPEYWEEVKRIAWWMWFEWDRKVIFNETWLTS